MPVGRRKLTGRSCELSPMANPLGMESAKMDCVSPAKLLMAHGKETLVKRIFRMLFKYKKLLLLPTVALVLSIALDSLNPFLNKMIIDRALPEKDPRLLLLIILGLLVITAGRAGFGYIKEYVYDVTSLKVYADIKYLLFDHIQSLHFQYFDNVNTGELMARMGEDTENIWRSLAFGFRLMVEQAVYFIIGILILGSINWKLMVIILLIMAPIAPIALRFEKKIDRNFEAISDQTAELNTTAQENIAGVRLVKAFARESHEMGKFFSKNKRNFDLNNEQAKIIADNFPVIELLTNAAVIVMICLGGVFVMSGEMTLGDLAVFSGFIWNLIWPLREIGWLMNMTAQFNASGKKILAILDTPAQVTDKPGLKSKVITGGIEFNHVSFAYGEELVLEDISFSAHPGDTVAIMGTTGSGKSSLVGLIGRYYNYQSGSVLIDGTDNRDIKLQELRRAMSIVPQDTFLFSESIGNNIKFGAGEATDEEIRQALETACAGFVDDFEAGLDTVIGERGVGLSGGQKQRLAIARAILRKSPILLLDDATSALDMGTEYELLRNLKSLNGRRTTFIIAHRISAVKNADLILYMEKGRIVERGRHEELVALHGRYYEVYREQFKDFAALKEVI